MSKRSSPIENIYQFCLTGPLWTGPVLAALGFSLLYWVIPALAGDSSTAGKILSSAIKATAPVVGLILLFVWAFSLAARGKRWALFEKQKNLETIRALSWQDFERLVGEAFRRQGFSITEHGGSGADGGVDLELRLNGQRWLVQCKHWRTRRVGVEPIRALYGVVAAENADGGYFITTGEFTKAAINFASSRLTLINGDQLWTTMQGLALHDIPANVIADDPTQTEVIPGPTPHKETEHNCPRCAAPMALKTARRGINTGSKFYGCSRFPKCRGTQEYR